MTSAPSSYDFRKPRQLADDVERELSAWQTTACALITDRWEQQLGVRLNWAGAGLSNVRRSQVEERIVADYACFAFRFQGVAKTMWFGVPRRLILATMAVMLGDEIQEFPEDRALTDVELAVMDLALGELSRVLTDSQPCVPPLIVEFQGSRRVQEFTREFSQQEPIALAEFDVTVAGGTGQVLWLLPQEVLLKFLTHLGELRQAASGSSDSLQQLVTQIPMQVVVRLGNARVHVSDLMNLQPGDVIVLDQRVSEPLAAEIGAQVVFRGWPGRVGTKQAFQVSELATRTERRSA